MPDPVTFSPDPRYTPTAASCLPGTKPDSKQGHDEPDQQHGRRLRKATGYKPDLTKKGREEPNYEPGTGSPAAATWQPIIGGREAR